MVQRHASVSPNHPPNFYLLAYKHRRRMCCSFVRGVTSAVQAPLKYLLSEPLAARPLSKLFPNTSRLRLLRLCSLEYRS
jgi:hypothetical protein